MGAVLSAFTGGHVSDWLGRRRVLRWALAMNILAGAVFLLPGLPSLLVARFLSGMSIGPLIAGILAQFAPHPLTLPYLVFEALLVLAFAGTFLMRETVERRETRWRPQRVSVPAGDRGRYAAACLTAVPAGTCFGSVTVAAVADPALSQIL